MLQTLEQRPVEGATPPAELFQPGEPEKRAVKTTGIAILGSNPHTVMQAPFADESWLIYACSPHNVEQRTLPRFNEWFEVHKPVQDKTRSYRYLRALEDAPVVWMRDKDNMHLFPGAREYPEAELRGTMKRKITKCQDGLMRAEVRDFKPGLFSYWHFTSSIAYILAKAIVDCERQGIRRIGLWGIMQQSETEYLYQRQGIQYFVDYAIRKGIQVVAPDCSLLFEPMAEVW